MSVLGNRVVRREDPKFLTVGGKYVDDVPLDGAAHVTFVRSTVAHARINSVDVSAAKVGKDLGEAVFAEPNNTYKFADVPRLGIRVAHGNTLDGLGKYLREVITEAPGPHQDVAGR